MNLIEREIFIPKGNLKIPRRNMPQVAEAHYSDLVRWLKQQRVPVRKSMTSAARLKPIQKEINASKVAEMAKTNHPKLKKPFLVTKDGYILDGHHRWLALLQIDKGVKVEVYQFDLPVKEALNLLRDYPRSTFKDVNNVEYNQPDSNMRLERMSIENFKDFYVTEGKGVDPESRVAVKGHGTVRVKDLEKGFMSRLNEVEKFAKKGDWRNVAYLLKNTALISFAEALNEVQGDK